jgi:RNA polymerase sigma-70 factor, ECF subfamily
MMMPDTEYLRRCRNGDTDAFRRIVDDHQSFAYAVAYRFLGNRADAEDAVQDSFIRVWEHLKDYDPRKKFSTWLYRIVANRCLDALRSRKRRGEEIAADSPAGESAIRSGDPEKANDDRETVGLVNELVRDLPEKQRMVFILRDLQDLSADETAEIMGMSGASVKSNLFHARRYLREAIIRLERRGL